MAVLKSLTVSQVEELRGLGAVRSYRKNEPVYELGGPADAVHFVLRGRVRLRDRDWEGRDITVSFAAEGEAFGLEALAELPNRRLAASAAENSEILTVRSEALKELLARDHELTRHLLRHAAELITHMDERVKLLAFLDVPSRLAGTLLWLADRYGVPGERGLEIPYWFTHQEIADLIGSTRETVTTILAEFKREGLVDSRDHHFVVLDRPGLTRRARLAGFGESGGEPA
jgi:CRP/FNR family transcriptional regulator